MIEQIILDLIADNKENFKIKNRSEYCEGYADGYNDGLVDLLDKLRIKHNEEIINQ